MHALRISLVCLALVSAGCSKPADLKQALAVSDVSTGWFDAGYLRHLVHAHQSGARDYSAPLWSLLMFEAFLRNSMGGLARKIPITFVTFAIATAAIAGIPPLAGFFSKDEILWYAFASTRGGSPLLWIVAAATALMTAFYMFRLLWLTFLGRSRMSSEVEHHVHESPWSMTGVLVVLAVLSALGGFIAVPHFLEPQLALPAIAPSQPSSRPSRRGRGDSDARGAVDGGPGEVRRRRRRPGRDRSLPAVGMSSGMPR